MTIQAQCAEAFPSAPQATKLSPAFQSLRTALLAPAVPAATRAGLRTHCLKINLEPDEKVVVDAQAGTILLTTSNNAIECLLAALGKNHPAADWDAIELETLGRAFVETDDLDLIPEIRDRRFILQFQIQWAVFDGTGSVAFSLTDNDIVNLLHDLARQGGEKPVIAHPLKGQSKRPKAQVRTGRQAKPGASAH